MFTYYQMQLVIITVCLLLFVSCAPINIKADKNIAGLCKEHKTIAILPFEVALTGGTISAAMQNADYKEALHLQGKKVQ